MSFSRRLDGARELVVRMSIDILDAKERIA